VRSHLDHGDFRGACLSYCDALSDDGNACTEDFGIAFNGVCFFSYTEVLCEKGKVCDPSDGECFVPLDIETLMPVDIETLETLNSFDIDDTGERCGNAIANYPDDDPFVTAVCIGGTWYYRRNI
jgi:hypothetical protein